MFRISRLLVFCRKRYSGLLSIVAAAGTTAYGGALDVAAPEDGAPSPSFLGKWWNGPTATGDWLGLRSSLEDHGLKLSGMWKGYFYGVVSGGLQQQGAFDEEIKFMADLDVARLTKLSFLDGLTASAKVRWRDGRNPNNYVGATSFYGPSDLQSGQQWRFNYVYLTYVTPELFGVKKLLTVSGGWQNPFDFFVDVPLQNLFVNNSLSGARGLANIPWSSSYAAWGGYFKIKPVDWWYAMNGFYMAIPGATALSNHGLYFQGYGPDPSQNGFFYIGETGFTPKLGRSRLPGKYAFGGYYYGNWNTSFDGARYPGKYGFYWQADQMLFREGGKSLQSSPADGKRVQDSRRETLSDQGLYAFSILSFAPPANNLLPFSFSAGLVYKGLVPTRDRDQAMVAISYGSYSIENIDSLQSSGVDDQPNFTTVLESDYRVQVNQWAYVQPFCQYIIHPNGTGDVQNATVLGLGMGITF